MRSWGFILVLVTGCGGRLSAEAPDDAASDADASSADAVGVDEGVDTGPEVPGKDTTPPKFAGCSDVAGLSEKTTRVFFSRPVDDRTPDADIVVRVYGGLGADAIDFTKPVAVATAGVSLVVPYDHCKITHYVCRARDLAGNEDGNTHVVTAFSSDARPCFAGLTGVTKVSRGRVKLTWTAGFDPVYRSEPVYDVYQATEPGGETMGKPTVTTAKGATSIELDVPVAKLYWLVRARTAGGTDDNAVEMSLYTGVSFTKEVEPVFLAKCATGTCHRGTTPAAGITLEPGKAYKAIVGVPSSWIPGLSVVTPGDPVSSTLLRILNNPTPHGPPPYPVPEYELLRAWIVEGALDL